MRAQVVWAEGNRPEAYIHQSVHLQFYRFMQACENFGYYPTGHPKERGAGSWLGVMRFGVRLVIASTASALCASLTPRWPNE